MIISPINPPRPPLIASEKSSFAYKTTRSRWPVIITKTIDDVYRAYNIPGFSGSIFKSEDSPNETEQRKKTEAKEIIEELSAMKYAIERDKPLVPLIPDQLSDFDTWEDVYQKYFAEKTWFSAPWLFTECYLYRRLNSAFARTTHWREYDPFKREKEDTFRKSYTAVNELAIRINELVEIEIESNKSEDLNKQDEEERRRFVFSELCQVSLWGNSTDLSLLTDLTSEAVKKLQTTGKGALKEAEKNILVNEIDKIWEKLKGLKGARIDIVLDNAGFELFGDMILAEWLIQAGYASEVYFHAKPIPWFVSDATPKDFHSLLSSITEPNFFNSNKIVEEPNIEKLSSRWNEYMKNHQWHLKFDYFWVSPYAYWHLHEKGRELFTDLCKSSLIFFKGDLNYRKLVYDCKWEFTTPFTEAIGPLNSQRVVPPIAALRTCKADVIVGLAEGMEEKMKAKEDDWLVSGKFAVVQYSPGEK
ncbi:hypothetical protein G9A89_012542 [Geosiphon pyriformis]|nr:hypothetical protein G9A89_012542 [Geosiphon pyriformis]